MTAGGDAEGEVTFDRAEYETAPAAFTCAACGRPIDDEYWQIGGAHVCTPCKEAFLRRLASEGHLGPMGRAAAFGAAAALLCGLVWWGVRAATGYEIGLIAIVVGFAVGAAVRYGSRRQGGGRYQALAMFLTYSGIAMSYVPDVYRAWAEAGDPGASVNAVVVLFIAVTAYSVPFLGGWKNILGILIIGFALYEAWKINRGGPVTANGPYRRSGSPSPGG